jgi:predicted RNase H-like HicB family nuclease
MRKAIDMARETPFDPHAEFIFEARRSGSWWALSVPELPGVHSQVRRLEQAEEMIRDAISLAFDALPTEVNVQGPVIVVNPELDELLRVTRSRREMLAELRVEVDSLSRRLAHEMADEGIPVRDIAQALDVSFQHAAKLAKT